jgi:hypothetical protein
MAVLKTTHQRVQASDTTVSKREQECSGGITKAKCGKEFQR